MPILYIVSVPMCNNTALQQKIRKRTGNGDLIVDFLADTVEGKYPDAKYHHKLEATKHLIRFGFPDTNPFVLNLSKGLSKDQTASAPESASNRPPLPQGEGWGEGENTSRPVTHLDILNYDIAHLIRQETADGHTIAEFLSDVMTRRDKPFTPKKLRIRHTDRMAAAREILRRGFGHFGRKRKLVVDDHDDSRRLRHPAHRPRQSECENTASTAPKPSASSSTSWKTPTPTSHTPGTTVCQQPTSFSAEAGTPTTTQSPLRCSRTTGATSSPPVSP